MWTSVHTPSHPDVHTSAARGSGWCGFQRIGRRTDHGTPGALMVAMMHAATVPAMPPVVGVTRVGNVTRTDIAGCAPMFTVRMFGETFNAWGRAGLVVHVLPNGNHEPVWLPIAESVCAVIGASGL